MRVVLRAVLIIEWALLQSLLLVFYAADVHTVHSYPGAFSLLLVETLSQELRCGTICGVLENAYDDLSA